MDAIKISSVRQMRLVKRQGLAPPPTPSTGSLHLTTHHLIFRPQTTGKEELWLPLPLLYSVTRTPPSLTGSPTPLVLRTRNFLVYDLHFSSLDESDGVWESLKGLCAGVATGGGLPALYAFFYEGEKPADRKGKGKAGWDIYDPVKEFARMGVGSRSKAWRFTEINADFEFCPSYPPQIVVPAKISDSTLSYAVKYRSKGRIPGLVYLHWANYGSITRSSQPMVGITQGARSIQDEKLIECIFTSHSQHSHPRQAFTLAPASASSSTASLNSQDGQVVYGAQATNIIIDARPSKNAYANSVKGAGSENMTFYKNCKKEYLGIDNIHVMRSSLNGVYDALRDSETTGHLDRTSLRRTNWLSHMTNILDGILIIVRTIHLSNSHVLVHCSDGWDRTSQLSALPQICLDPYYRTAVGLAVLIEKDWISYGHRFADRSGHLCGDRVDFVTTRGDDTTAQSAFLASVTRQFSPNSHAFKETCPVFQQFLDCIYQLQRQFPERFEWNEKLLRRLQWETYAGRSGTFLFNSERERAELKAREKTKSVWEGIFDEADDGTLTLKEEFRNPLYNTAPDDPDSRDLDADQGVLLVNPQDVKWWFELFGRDDEEMNGRPLPPNAAPEDVPSPTITKVTVVEGLADDPVLSPLSALNLNPSSSATSDRSTSPLPPPSRTQSPATVRSPTTELPPAQVQINEAVSSVQKFGWSAWKTVQKYGQEAAAKYAESQAAAQAALDREREQREAAGYGHGRREDGGSTWRAMGSSDGTSELRAPPPSKPFASVNPWAGDDEMTSTPPTQQSRPPPPSSSSTAPSPSPAPARFSTPPPSTSSFDPLNAISSSSPPSALSRLNANPWGDRPPTSTTKPLADVVAEEKKPTSNGAKSADVDPLGVGFA